MKIIDAEPKQRPLIPPSLHTRYTRAWTDNLRYRWIARVLELTRFVELLIEMGLRRRVSAKGRWRGIIVLEAVKCVFFCLVRCLGLTECATAGLSFV